MIDKTISHYKIIEKLGEGGMGEVYLADDLKLDRRVAIKYLPEHLTKDKNNVERFKREAKAAAALNHPNIITIHDIIESENQICIVMEYVEGKSLRDVMNDYDLRLDKIIDILRQISEGLREAHKAGIVHRDMKPENIIIGKDARIRILDFGLAKLKGVSQLTKETSTLGTIGYMSPEQLQGLEIDHRSDIWSLGVIFYEMLTGELPFQGEYESALHYTILNEQPKLLTDIKERYSFNLGKFLEKQPNRRHQSCQEVLQELHQISMSGSAKGTKKHMYLKFGVILMMISLIASVFLILNQEDGDQSIKSLAVLPLENLSDDPTQEYFVDGITDVLISKLAHLRALKVISRTSVMQYKGIHKSLTNIANELDVDAIVEGTVFSDGQRIRISTQLIRASDDTHLWSDIYEYEMTDIFVLQNTVASAIAGAVKVKLTEQEKTRFATAKTVNPQTYQIYLKGRYNWNKRTQEGILKAIDFFKKAIEEDPDYAAAYAGLADCYIIEPAFYMELPEKAYSQAKDAALRALELDDKLAEAYVSLAAVKHNYEWAWSDAEKLYKHAIELNPNSATAHQWYAELLMSTGRIEEAKREIKHASEIDPLSPIIKMQLANYYYYVRDYDRAIHGFQKALELYPNFLFTHLYLSFTFSKVNKHKEAVRSMQKVNSLEQSPRNLAYLGYINAVSGNTNKAVEICDSLTKLSNMELLPHASAMAVLYIGLGDYDQAFYWLEKAYDHREYDLNFLKVEPLFDPLADDQRFTELLKKMGLEG
jgi:serine/threonine-protein kinase